MSVRILHAKVSDRPASNDAGKIGGPDWNDDHEIEGLDHATEAVAGLVELATLAEAIAGTDAARAVTPAGVQAAVAGEFDLWGLNVKMLGVTGLGVDESAEFQAILDTALDTLQRVYVPAGHYFAKHLKAPSSLTLFGDGKYSSIMYLAANANTYLMASSTYVDNVSYVDGPITIRDIGFDGNDANQSGTSGDGLIILRSYRCSVSDFSISNVKGRGLTISCPSANGTPASGSEGTVIHHGFIDGCDGAGIYGADDSSNSLADIDMHDMEIESCGRDGAEFQVQFERGAGLRMRHMRMFSPGSINIGNIKVLDCGVTMIQDSVLDHSTGGLINVYLHMGGFGDLSFTGNQLSDGRLSAAGIVSHLFLKHGGVYQNPDIGDNVSTFVSLTSSEAESITPDGFSAGSIRLGVNSYYPTDTEPTNAAFARPLHFSGAVTQHGLFVGDGTGRMSQIAPVAAGYVLGSAAGPGLPAWVSELALGNSALATHGKLALHGSTSGVVAVTPEPAAGTYDFRLPTGPGTAGQPLLSGAGIAPQTYGTLGIPGGGTGQTTAAAAAAALGLGTGNTPELAGLNLGHATDTTITRVSAGLIAVEGSNVLLASGLGSITQAYHANLAAFADLSLIADRLPYGNGPGTLALATFTAAGRALIDDADAAAQRTTLGLTAYANAAVGQLPGTTTNDSASAGNIGQTVSANVLIGSAVSIAASYGGPYNIASISLTAGCWLVYAIPFLKVDGTHGVGQIDGYITPTTGGSSSVAMAHGAIGFEASYVPQSDLSFSVGPVFVQLTSTTTYYLTMVVGYGAGGTFAGYGSLLAVRIR